MRADELNVRALAGEVRMSRQATSNQLQRLSKAGIVIGRQEGLQVFYRAVDPCVSALFDRAWCHIEDLPTNPDTASRMPDLATAK